MEIVKATKEDIPRLCELLDYLFTKENEFSSNKELQEQGLTAILEDEKVGEIFVIKENDYIVGMINLLYTISTALGTKVAILEDMVVDPDHRNKEIGSTLLEYAIDYLTKTGCKRITLLSDIDNCDAHKFYVARGFQSSLMMPFRKKL